MRQNNNKQQTEKGIEIMNARLLKKVKVNDVVSVKKKDQYSVGHGIKVENVLILNIVTEGEMGAFPLFEVALTTGEVETFTHRFFDGILSEEEILTTEHRMARQTVVKDAKDRFKAHNKLNQPNVKESK